MVPIMSQLPDRKQRVPWVDVAPTRGVFRPKIAELLAPKQCLVFPRLGQAEVNRTNQRKRSGPIGAWTPCWLMASLLQGIG